MSRNAITCGVDRRTYVGGELFSGSKFESIDDGESDGDMGGYVFAIVQKGQSEDESSVGIASLSSICPQLGSFRSGVPRTIFAEILYDVMRN